MRLRERPVKMKWVVAAFLLVICLLMAGYILFPSTPDDPPNNVIGKALKNTENAKKYRYTIRMSTTIDGQEKTASNVEGQRESRDRIHIRGHIFESEIEFYLVDDITYTKDQLTGEWVKLTGNQLNQQEIFMAELNPLASFTYKELKEANFEGAERLNGQRLLVYTAVPVIDNPYMEILWKDFRYKFWLKPQSLQVYRGEVAAVSKNDSTDKLHLIVDFRDYNGDIDIKPPI